MKTSALLLLPIAVLAGLSLPAVADDAFDKQYLARRDPADEAACQGLLAIARKLERKGLLDRAKELVLLAQEKASDARKKDTQALLEKIGDRTKEGRDDAIEKELDDWAARTAKKYQEIAAYCEKRHLGPEAADCGDRLSWCVKVSPAARREDPAPATPDAKGGDKASDKGDIEKVILDRVNFHRKNAGLPLVTLDADLSKGCKAHCNYLVVNDGKEQLRGLAAHEEDMSLPGATEHGAKAGRNSDIAWGDGPADSVDAWVASLYHRVPILHPGLKKIGAGFMTGTSMGKVCCLDIQSACEDAKKEVLYPVDKQTGVALKFCNEMPNPLGPGQHDAGYPVTLSGFGLEPLKDCSAKLEKDGKEVSCAYSSPEKPATDSGQPANTICLIPRAPLDSGATYKATFNYTKEDGAKVTRTVTFKTR